MFGKSLGRRSFLYSSALAAGAISCTTGDSKKDQSMNDHSNGHIVGHGDFRYRVHKQWGVQDLSKIPVQHCHEMQMSKDGSLYLCNTDTKNNIIVYDRSGKVMRTWGTEYPGIHGLTINHEGGEEFLYLTDTDRHQVYKTTLDGRVLLTIDYPSEAGIYDNANQFVPTETTVTDTGEILVADGYGRNYVVRYDQHGRYLGHFAGKGDDLHQVHEAHGICVDRRKGQPTLLVTSRARQEVKRYTMDGQYLSTIKLPGCSICRPVIHGSNVYFAVLVTKTWGAYDGMVAVLDADDRVVSFPGGSAPIYENDVLQAPEYDGFTFLNPHDVCIDNDENIYVPQWNSGRTYPVMLERI